MSDSPLPRAVLLSGGLLSAALLIAYGGLGFTFSHHEPAVLAGLPEPTRLRAEDLYSSVRWQPWNSAAYMRLGELFLANNRTAPAIEWLRRATGWSSGFEPWYYLGLAQRAAHRIADADASFRAVLRINPDYVAARVQLANLLLDRGLPADAAAAFKDLPGTVDRPRVFNGLGIALLQQHDYPNAQRAFSTALARFSAYGEARAGLAAALKAQGDETRAAREARLAFNWRAVVPIRTDDPLTESMEQDFPTGLSLFQSAARNRDPRVSLAPMEKAVALDPSMTFAWEYLITLYGLAQRPQDAEKAWGKLQRLDPKSTRGRYELAVALTQNGNRPKARTLLNEALALDPAFAEAHRMLGVIAQVDGNRDEAARQFRAAFETDPALAEAHVDLGLMLIAGGDTKQGQAELLRALLPPAEQPERTLTRELASLAGNAAEPAFEQAVRAQATAQNQLSLITLLNTRATPAPPRP